MLKQFVKMQQNEFNGDKVNNLKCRILNGKYMYFFFFLRQTLSGVKYRLKKMVLKIHN